MSQKKGEIVVGLDIGTTKICCIVGEITPTGIELKPEVRLFGSFNPPLPLELQPHHVAPILLQQNLEMQLPDAKKTFLRVSP